MARTDCFYGCQPRTKYTDHECICLGCNRFILMFGQGGETEEKGSESSSNRITSLHGSNLNTIQHILTRQRMTRDTARAERKRREGGAHERETRDRLLSRDASVCVIPMFEDVFLMSPFQSSKQIGSTSSSKGAVEVPVGLALLHAIAILADTRGTQVSNPSNRITYLLLH